MNKYCKNCTHYVRSEYGILPRCSAIIEVEDLVDGKHTYLPCYKARESVPFYVRTFEKQPYCGPKALLYNEIASPI